jgi:hypothetical protein
MHPTGPLTIRFSLTTDRDNYVIPPTANLGGQDFTTTGARNLAPSLAGSFS